MYLKSDFLDSQSYIEKLYLKKQNKFLREYLKNK